MNVQLKDITVTARDGRVSHLDQVYIRGSHVRFFIVPDMLRHATPTMLENSGGLRLTDVAGMRRCSGPGARGVEVLVWREEGQRSTGRGARLEAEDEVAATGAA